MMDALPPDIDSSEAQIPYDFTRPAANIKAGFAGFELNETIRLIFPQWSYDEWLDLHAEQVRVLRKEANKASGTLDITGIVGTVIPSGHRFATPAGISPSVLFETVDETVLDGTPDERGMVTVSIYIQAVEGGTAANVPVDSIKLESRPVGGITKITNPDPITGGTLSEDDDSLIERILAAMRQGASFVGNNADYIRWAKEVDGVGGAICIPEAFGPGTVELIIVDGNGIPANQQILDAVYLHITGTGASDIARLAPIGATLTVSSPTGATIDISADVLLDSGESIGAVLDRFKSNLAPYWNAVAQEAQENSLPGYVRWVMVGAVLAKTQGVVDYTNLLINGGTSNIPITQKQYPVTGTVTLNDAGEVVTDG